MTRAINPRLLEILVCPLSKARLEYDAAAQELVCYESGLAYPIHDGVPVMLVEEARMLGEDAPDQVSGGAALSRAPPPTTPSS